MSHWRPLLELHISIAWPSFSHFPFSIFFVILTWNSCYTPLEFSHPCHGDDCENDNIFPYNCFCQLQLLNTWTIAQLIDQRSLVWYNCGGLSCSICVEYAVLVRSTVITGELIFYVGNLLPHPFFLKPVHMDEPPGHKRQFPWFGAPQGNPSINLEKILEKHVLPVLTSSIQSPPVKQEESPDTGGFKLTFPIFLEWNK